MYFCNTCGQPLCAPCREETHRARMFTRHEIVSLSKRTKDIHKKCRECHAGLPRAMLCCTAPCQAMPCSCPLQHCTRSPTSCSPLRRSPCSASTASGICRGE